MIWVRINCPTRQGSPGIEPDAPVLKLRYFFIVFPGKNGNLTIFGHLFDPLRGSPLAFFPGNLAFVESKKRNFKTRQRGRAQAHRELH